MGTKWAAAALFVLLAQSLPAWGRVYNIAATGEQLNARTPRYLGMGMGYGAENSNTWTWLRYLGVTQARHFAAPLVSSSSAAANTGNWRTFVSHQGQTTRFNAYGDQFGKAFGGALVGDAAAFLAAVAELRALAPNTNAAFFTWLQSHKPVNWPLLLRALNTTSTNSALLGQNGNPHYVITELVKQGYQVTSLWDIRCKNLAYTSTDPADPEHWKERWET
jgi:hypothetical protein